MIDWIMDADLPEPILKKMQDAADQSLICEGIHFPCSISVRLCNDPAIREINTSIRGVPCSTDVLSFPTVSYPPDQTAGSCESLLRQEFDDETGTCFLGDIVISVPHLYAQAEEYGHSSEREATYLLVHGICHLMGYDHLKEADKIKMRRAEEKILSESAEKS